MTLRNILFWRTFALIALVVALVSATLFQVLHLRHHVVAQREAEANAVFLASQCVKPVLWDDRLLLKSLLFASVEKKVVEYAWLERDGKLLAHTFPLGMPKGLLELHPPGGKGASTQAWKNPGGRVFYDIAAPLPAPAGGILHVGLTEDAVDEGVADMRPVTAAIALLSLVLGAVLAWLMANAVTRESRAAIQALAASELKYRTLADNTADWEFWIGPDEKPIYNSPSCERIIGYTPNELAANPGLFTGIIHPDDRQRFAAHRHTASQAKLDDELELRIVHKDGEVRWLSHRCRPVFGQAGEYLGTRGANTDITKRKRAEESLHQLNETLEQRVAEEVAKNREKDHLMIQQSRLAAMGEMIGNIAHQWRQPINALTLVLANIKDAYEYNELDKEYLDKAVKSGQHLIQTMSSTIDDFRNFFKPSTEKKPFSMCDGAMDAVNLVAASYRSHNVEIIMEKCGVPCYVRGYPSEFSQVVLNALSNAKDAISARKIAGKVRVGVEMRGGFSVLTVQDNGGGIPEEILDKVFDPYFTTKEKGTGIGLYMSKMIMEKMGGDIVIRNVVEGAEVVISLPLADDLDVA